MFTGLVEETGQTVRCERTDRSARLIIAPKSIHRTARTGESIAVNGCCLTVIAVDGEQVAFDAIPETLDRTNLGDLVPGDPVNLERPLAVSARLDGHFVQGHIDGVGRITSLVVDENAVVVEIEAPERLRKYLVEKGSIAIDGVSLTVASVGDETFTVWTIPHTRQITTLGEKAVGDRVNLECDLLGKYIERLMEKRFDVGNKIECATA